MKLRPKTRHVPSKDNVHSHSGSRTVDTEERTVHGEADISDVTAKQRDDNATQRRRGENVRWCTHVLKQTAVQRVCRVSRLTARARAACARVRRLRFQPRTVHQVQ